MSYAVVFFLTVQVIDTPARRRALARTAVVSGLIVSMYGLLQYAGLDPIDWGPLPFEAQRSFSAFGNPNLLGGYLIFPLALSAALALTDRRWQWRMFFWGVFLVVSTTLLTTFTRGAWIGGTVALCAVLGAALRGAVRPSRVDLSFLTAALGASVIVVVRSLRSASEVMNVASRLRSMFVLNEGSASTRVEIWRGALRAVQDRPIRGYGADTFRLVFPHHKSAAYVMEAGYQNVADNAHSYPLQAAVSFGVPGALLLYGLFAWQLIKAIPLALGRAVVEDRLVLASFWGAAVGYLVHLLFGLSVPGSTFLLWLFLGALAVPGAVSRYVSAPRWGRAGVVVVVLVVFLGLAGSALPVAADHYYLVGQDPSEGAAARSHMLQRATALNPARDVYRAEVGHLNRAEMAYWLSEAQAMQRDGRDTDTAMRAAESAFLRAIGGFRDALDSSPWETDHYANLAEVYNAAGWVDPSYHQQALEVAQRGIEIAPLSPVLRYQAAVAYAALGARGPALQQLETVVGVSNLYLELWLLTGRLRAEEGDRDGASAAYRQALVLDPTNSDALLALSALSQPDEGRKADGTGGGK